MAAGKTQQRGQVGHRIAVDAIAGQGVEHIQELVAFVLHRPEAAPAGHPGDEAARRLAIGPGAAGPGHRAHAQITLFQQAVHFAQGTPRLKMGVFDEAPLVPKEVRGRSGRGDTCTASYVSRRLTAPPSDAVVWAAAITSLKLETEGPFRRDMSEAQALYEQLKGT